MIKSDIFKKGLIGFLAFTLLFGVMGTVVHAQDLVLEEKTRCKVRANVTTNESRNLGHAAPKVFPAGSDWPLTGALGGDNAIVCAFSLIKWISIVIFGVLIAIAVLMIAYSAFLFVSSGDDQGRRKKAKQVLLWAVVGLIVASVARLIPTIAQSILLAG